ncbi:MAG: FAD-binding and (Fe-S)-binding domain-containing protein [Prevotella sp.]
MLEIYSDSLHKIAYATDASAYREIPRGVTFPQCGKDFVDALKMAKIMQTCLIARAGGTSIAGQVVGNGIIMDVSRHLNHIIEINEKERWARVEPGVVLDELNIALKKYGLFFSPETSTSNRCCIGGMTGNNSCGSHSLIYGSTRHHILEAKVILTDGSEELLKEYTIAELEERFGKDFWTKPSEKLIVRIYSQLINWALDEETMRMITESYPDKTLRRRSSGYAIDETIEDIADKSKPMGERRINLCRVVCGSEGTLAFVTEIKVDLDVLPPEEKMALCVHCDSLEKCYQANLVCLEHQPDAIELIDGHILELSKRNAGQRDNRFFVNGDPKGLLVVELSADNRDDLKVKADRLERALTEGDDALAYCCTRVDKQDITKVWSLRKAGLGLLGGMKGDAKPIGVIEDTAVAPQRLPEYLKDIKEMLDRLGLNCVFYGHISTGELHLRPIIDIKTDEGRKMFRQVAEQTARIVKKHRGSLSGEHGDGRLRGEFIPLMYGEQAYELMRQLKSCWDPDGLMNMGKIVDTPPMDECLRYEAGQKYEAEKWMDCGECRELMLDIEQCNGAADCRKSTIIGGGMCPVYKATKDETMTTRARANVLREVMTRGGDETLIERVMDSCLACKACKRECPSNVDMTWIRARVLNNMHERHGMKMRTWLVARMATIERIGQKVAPIYNFCVSFNPTAYIIKGVLRFSTQRKLPRLSRHTMRQLVARECRGKGDGRRVYLFADEFTNYQEAELGLKFARLLTDLGYKVVIPEHVESGRAAISKGNLKYAAKIAAKNVALLKDIITEEAPLVGIEPSCILTFRDEYPKLVDEGMKGEAERLAKNCLLYDEFMVREMEAGRISSEQFEDNGEEIWLHGHCHQKALVGIEKTAQMIRGLLPKSTLHVIPSGCCGMAGAYGYDKEHYEMSRRIGEEVLFPAVRKAEGVVLAPGTSCREQIAHFCNVKALHPIEILKY